MERFDRMTGPRKAALFLMVMGEEFAAKVYKHLDEDDINILGEHMTKIKDVDPKAIAGVIEEFSGVTRGNGLLGTTGQNFFERSVSKAFNTKKATDFMESIGSGKRRKFFEKLKALSPDMLVNFISNEHPQTIALILSNLSYPTAAEAVKLLPENIQGEVIGRIARLESVPDEIVEEIQGILEQEVSNFASSGPRTMGGIKVAAEILNHVDQKTEKAILEKIEEEQEELADQIRQSMFIFEDLVGLDDRGIRALLKEVSNDELLLALKTASEGMRQKIFGNLSQRASEMLKEDMEVMGPVRVKDVEAAQQNIIKTARRLEEEGKIVLGGKGGDDIIV